MGWRLPAVLYLTYRLDLEEGRTQLAMVGPHLSLHSRECRLDACNGAMLAASALLAGTMIVIELIASQQAALLSQLACNKPQSCIIALMPRFKPAPVATTNHNCHTRYSASMYVMGRPI